MNRTIRVIFVFILVCNLIAVKAFAADLKGQLIISGSDAMERLTTELAKGFMKIHTDVKIVLRSGESGKGISDTRNGSANIGMVSRELNSDESINLQLFTIAYEGICFITSEKNPVKDVSKEHLKEIYLGKRSNWKSVGGNDLPISMMIPYRKSASNKIVAELFGVSVGDLKGTEIKDLEEGMKVVSRDPRALLYVSTGKAFSEKLNGMPINILSVSGKKANMVSISQNRYPLVRALNFITLGDPKPLAKAFISYCMSPAAAHTIRANYFIKPQL